MLAKLHLFLVGPPAVGKLTVGRILSQSTDFPLSDSARSIDTATLLFPYGTAGYREFRDELRFSFYSRAGTSQIPGLISTCCLARNSWPYFRRVEALLSATNWQTIYVLLTADESSLFARVESPDRRQKTALMTPASIREWLAKNWPTTFPEDVRFHSFETTMLSPLATSIEVKALLDL